MSFKQNKYKIGLIGEEKSGKTSFMWNYTANEFYDLAPYHYQPSDMVNVCYNDEVDLVEFGGKYLKDVTTSEDFRSDFDLCLLFICRWNSISSEWYNKFIEIHDCNVVAVITNSEFYDHLIYKSEYEKIFEKIVHFNHETDFARRIINDLKNDFF